MIGDYIYKFVMPIGPIIGIVILFDALFSYADSVSKLWITLCLGYAIYILIKWYLAGKKCQWKNIWSQLKR